jgi:hypothetical protein
VFLLDEDFPRRRSDGLFLGNSSDRWISRCCGNVQLVTYETAIGSVTVVLNNVNLHEIRMYNYVGYDFRYNFYVRLICWVLISFYIIETVPYRIYQYLITLCNVLLFPNVVLFLGNVSLSLILLWCFSCFIYYIWFFHVLYIWRVDSSVTNELNYCLLAISNNVFVILFLLLVYYFYLLLCFLLYCCLQHCSLFRCLSPVVNCALILRISDCGTGEGGVKGEWGRGRDVGIWGIKLESMGHIYIYVQGVSRL